MTLSSLFVETHFIDETAKSTFEGKRNFTFLDKSFFLYVIAVVINKCQKLLFCHDKMYPFVKILS